MKERRIWIVIGCILVIGAAVTGYTHSMVKDSMGAGQTATAAAAAVPRAASAAPQESAAAYAAKEPEPALGGMPEALADEPETTSADAARGGGTLKAQESETSDVLSPLTGSAADAGAGPGAETDYLKRLEEIDQQTERRRREESDSSAYTLKTSREMELKVWEGEMNVIYEALLGSLDEEESLQLSNEQQEWLRKREKTAAGAAGRSGAAVDSLEYVASLAGQTRARAYELARRFEKSDPSLDN